MSESVLFALGPQICFFDQTKDTRRRNAPVKPFTIDLMRVPRGAAVAD